MQARPPPPYDSLRGPWTTKVGRELGGGLGRFQRKEEIVKFRAALKATSLKPLEGLSLRKLLLLTVLMSCLVTQPRAIVHMSLL